MKKVIIPIISILLFSCNSQKWDKTTAKKAFMDQLPKEQTKSFTPEMIDKLCDCMAEKVVSKYKSMKEANSDVDGMKQLGADCGKQLAANGTSKTGTSSTATPQRLKLIEIAKNQNAKCPVMVNTTTRFDSVVVVNDTLIEQEYTLPDADILTTFNADDFYKKMYTTLNQKYKTDAEFAFYRENKINIGFNYSDKNQHGICYVLCK
jgi:hypothetical protein